MIDILSISRACSGKSSETCTPGTAVEIALSGPRNSAGASGLGSYVSCCGGPPSSQIKITDRSPGRPAPLVPAAPAPATSSQRQPGRPETANLQKPPAANPSRVGQEFMSSSIEKSLATTSATELTAAN